MSSSDANANASAGPLMEWKAKYGQDIVAFKVHGAKMFLGTYHGVPVTAFCTPEQFEDLKHNFVHQESDVWICTYLKSGTTWMQDICKLMLGKTTAENPLAAVPWLEISPQVQMIGLPVSVANTLPPSNGFRFFKTHWYPRDHVQSNGKSKFIYVARDGLDVCLSLYHHIHGFPMYDYDGSLDDFFEKFLRGEVDFGSWWTHIKQWWPRRKDADVLFLHYEELLAAPRANIKAIAAFIGAKLDNKQIDEIAHATSFEQMAARPILYDMLRKPTATKFLRRGKSGEGRETFTADQVRRFEEKCRAEFVGSAADYPWQRAHRGAEKGHHHHQHETHQEHGVDDLHSVKHHHK